MRKPSEGECCFDGVHGDQQQREGCGAEGATERDGVTYDNKQSTVQSTLAVRENLSV